MNYLTLEPTEVPATGETGNDLESVLREIATEIARILAARRCSILLVSDGNTDGQDGRSLQVFAHYGDLNRAAYRASTPLNQGIAGSVARTGKSLLIPDIRRSPFREMARYDDSENPSFLSVPVFEGERVVGVINVSRPERKLGFEERDREILEILSHQVARSLQFYQLQGMVRSRFVTMALHRELEEERDDGDLFERAVRTPPPKLAKIVAKSFFKELTRAGFAPQQIIETATEVLNLLQKTLDKHKNRLEGRD